MMKELIVAASMGLEALLGTHMPDIPEQDHMRTVARCDIKEDIIARRYDDLISLSYKDSKPHVLYFIKGDYSGLLIVDKDTDRIIDGVTAATNIRFCDYSYRWEI